MAIYDDDFEAYSLGATPPFGSWTGSGAIITSGGPYPSNSKTVTLSNGFITYVAVSYQNSISVFFAFKVVIPSSALEIARFDNGPNGSGQTSTLFHLNVESDGTITAKVTASGEIIGNSRDDLVRYDAWNFAQINFELSDVASHVHVNCHIALNGKEVISRSFDTAVLLSGLTNGTAEVNRFVLISSGCVYDNFNLDTLQAIVTYPHPGTPKIYIDQGAIELARVPDSAKTQVIQGAIEIAMAPDSAKILIYQGVIELLIERTVQQGLWKVKEI